MTNKELQKLVEELSRRVKVLELAAEQAEHAAEVANELRSLSARGLNK